MMAAMGTQGPEAASRIADLVRPRGAEFEHARTLAPDVAQAMRDAGLFRMPLPKELGGTDADLMAIASVIETVSAADASTGWCLMIGAGTNAFAGYLERDAAEEMWADPDIATAGVVMPRGTATSADNGYRVSGRWPFASFCEHAAWLCGGCIVDGGPPRLVFFPASDVTIHDTWHVAGLRGTGSHDIEVRDILVPAGRSAWFETEPWPDGPLYRIPFLGVLSSTLASVALGIARGALDEFVRLARDKVPTGSGRTVAQRETVQSRLAQSEAAVEAARVYLHDRLASAWDIASRGDKVGGADHAQVRLASTHATHVAVKAVDFAYEAGGTSALYTSSPLQRAFRDIHAASQHIMVAAPSFEPVGRTLLGLDPASPMF